MSVGWGWWRVEIEIWEKQNECEDFSRQILQRKYRTRNKLARTGLAGFVDDAAGWGIQGCNGDGSLEKLSLRTPKAPWSIWLVDGACKSGPAITGSSTIDDEQRTAAED
ncbi:hypothetical protein PspLS_08603, partial [Pyricularia sp. CBS 133598]